ncbi:N-acyl homoserine lactonase family protein [Desulfosporosinus sp. PR]|uniref:N-acyl homoserine lactonase family protein n=1 Tax=Candidatus Desulfosporosinus nitrosoreducens TaxID=3401928 RepID=UPI0027F21631|nr:N-acyl homoserine lactonase family protein [Desulfosporosinus sp. PR]MDQ7093561.1 N-acyl homoserine lactonase family protein [Desulfosporosinus sp. PR]
MAWRIIPLELGRLAVLPKILVWDKNSNHEGETGRIQVPLIGWLLLNEQTGEKILVDSGGGEDEEFGTKYHNPLTCNPENHLEAALRKHATTVNEIKTVILTHLHWDHAYGVLKLPQAKVIVQKAELQYAVAPDHEFIRTYELDLPDRIPYFLRYFKQIQTVSGDVELTAGIRLLFLPGHSAGSQGVLIDTKEGSYIIPGDLVNIKRNWEESLPPGIYNDLEACYASMQKLREIADENKARVLFDHDFAAFEQFAQVR